jgi:hypothetical protein
MESPLDTEKLMTKDVIQDNQIQANVVSTPIQTNDVATPIQTNDVATPIQTNDVATPIQTNDVATPIQANDVATPIQTNDVVLEGLTQDSFFNTPIVIMPILIILAGIFYGIAFAFDSSQIRFILYCGSVWSICLAFIYYVQSQTQTLSSSSA